MRFAGRERIRFFVLSAIIATLGTASLVYILLNQRLANPFIDTYTVTAELPEADGVVGGLGQPVNVAGVKVGSITGSERSSGHALITLEIERELLPHVHEGATVDLEPITPLEDMQLDLEPGDPAGPALAEDATIPVAGNTSPVPLANLLGSLDYDTRAYLRALISSLGEGTDGAGADLRGMLRAMGPTTRQVGRISSSLAKRRTELSRLVTNVARVTRAASRDERLVTLVAAGNRTLEAIAAEDEALDASLARLPGTLAITRETLHNAGRFSERLAPALTELRPAVRQLPATMSALRPFAQAGAEGLEGEIRPLLRELQPLAGDLRSPVEELTAIAPDLWDATQALQYGLNDFAYNPPGRDEGGLFWTDWFAHNANSAFGYVGDAHGRTARSIILGNCQQWAGLSGDIGSVLQAAAGVSTICPVTRSPDEVG